ncbi:MULTISPECIES: 2-phospho-L-lactate transferase [unclassified Leifsonia]|uniref:2-phospho-L-lactate transferase n=1 Tax=unclassified Leifsonia TaxID=2663824 RepID=UPI0006F40918|nr:MULTISPECIES: 2-phospho-L-lactate transferase [unclassified Leifsonia]KQX04986.1 2-phospho-L-lactate transferase [Leifsonia sp. Root1293]KRA08618.1 2-phospho-L-lactate transferase [Leifsonia sp. Root60]
MTKITILAGGVGGARFTRGLLAHLSATDPAATVTVVANTGDDLWLAGLRVCPDLDSIMYTLGGANDDERGWGRTGETERVSAELAAYGVGWPWFTLGDLDLGTHIARSSWLRDGLPLSEATRRLAARWDLGVTLLPATDDEVETIVTVAADPADTASSAEDMHFEEWWVRLRASRPALAFTQRNVFAAQPAPGVLDAIAEADVVLFAPSNPVVSIGTILGIPGIADAVRSTPAPVVGVSPIIGGGVVRGMADACLSAIGVETSAAAVAQHYGSRRSGGLIDGWLVDEVDADVVAVLEADGIRSAARPLWFSSVEETAAIAGAALALAVVRHS